MRDQREVGAVLAGSQRHSERVEDQVGTHVAGELPADDHPAVDVEDEREEQQALPAPQIREIADPQPVRRLGGEVTLDEIRLPNRGRVARRGPPRLPASLRAPDPVLARQPLHLAARSGLALAPQRLPQPPVPIRLVVLLVRHPDHLQQPLVLERARGSLA